VSAGTTDLANVDVSLQSGARITGRVAFDGTHDHPAARDLRRMQLMFTPVDGRVAPGTTGVGAIDEEGLFRSVPLLPGKYTVSVRGVMPDVWRLKSAMLNGRDHVDQPLTLDASDLAGLVLTLTDHPTSLTGRVRDASGNGDKNASVVVFTTDPARWTDSGVNPRTIRLLRASPSGAYGLGGLPAGDYFAVAIDDQAAAGWSDPKRLDLLSRSAMRISLADGEKKTLDLVTVIR
jgi:hypothetical protein